MRIRAGTLAVVLCASVFVFVVTAPAAHASSSSTPSAGGAAYQKVLTASIGELQRYWADQYPDLYGEKYQPIPRARVVAARPGVKIPSCQGERVRYADVRGNAFYCLQSNFIAYDDVALMPRLAETFGTFSVALVLAHEWGHGIQDRAGNGNEQTVYLEQQADCFAGAFLSHVAEDSTTLELKPGDLEASLGAMLVLRDAPGKSAADPSAHGSAFDRISAFQDGFESGAEKCATYFETPPVLVEIPFSNAADARSGGETAAEDVIPLTVDLLNDFYSQVEPSYSPLSTEDFVSFDSSKPRTIPKCGGTKLAVEQVENRVFYCLDDGYIGFDEPFLQTVYDEIGDFGVASLISTAWGTYVQTIQEIPGVADNGLEVVFQTDCYSGG